MLTEDEFLAQLSVRHQTSEPEHGLPGPQKQHEIPKPLGVSAVAPVLLNSGVSSLWILSLLLPMPKLLVTMSLCLNPTALPFDLRRGIEKVI